jgi:hypothetical protein
MPWWLRASSFAWLVAGGLWLASLFWGPPPGALTLIVGLFGLPIGMAALLDIGSYGTYWARRTPRNSLDTARAHQLGRFLGLVWTLISLGGAIFGTVLALGVVWS